MDKLLLIMGLKIVLVRVVEVSIATIRYVVTVKNKALLAAILGFLETYIWFTIVQQAIQFNGNIYLVAIFYALGFALGTYIGNILANILVKGTSTIQIITDEYELVNILRKAGYAVSVMNAEGQNNKEKYLLLLEVKNKTIKKVRKIVEDNDSQAFVIEKESSYHVNGLIN